MKLSAVFFSCRHRAFLSEALASLAGQQGIEWHDVVLCDDGSNDGSQEILREFAERESVRMRVKLVLHPVNVGWAESLRRGLAEAEGDLFVIFSGDDISEPDRAAVLRDRFLADPGRIRYLCSNAMVVDRAGQPQGLFFLPAWNLNLSAGALVANMNGALGATEAIHRDLRDRFEPMPEGVYQEDLVFPFRAALIGRGEYVDRPLVRYRAHEHNMYQNSGINPSREIYRATQAKRVTNQIGIARLRLQDVERALSRGWIDANLAEEIRLTGERTLRNLLVELEVFTARGLRPWKSIVLGMFHGVPFARVLRYAIMHVSPRSLEFVLSFVRGGKKKTGMLLATALLCSSHFPL